MSAEDIPPESVMLAEVCRRMENNRYFLDSDRIFCLLLNGVPDGPEGVPGLRKWWESTKLSEKEERDRLRRSGLAKLTDEEAEALGLKREEP